MMFASVPTRPRPRKAPKRKYAGQKRKLSGAPPPLRPKQRAKLLNEDVIADLPKQHCGCEKQCFKQFSFTAVKNLREDNLRKTHPELSEWLVQSIQSSTKENMEVVYSVKGINVCREAFRVLHGLSRHKLDECE